MSLYGLIKATSKAMRSDTIIDLSRVNYFLSQIGITAIVPYGPSVRALENSVALGLSYIKDRNSLPKLERSVDFYDSIIPEIKQHEKEKFKLLNPLLSLK